MRRATWMIVAMAAVALPACDPVESTVPMGLEPATLSPEDWDGLWLGDGVVWAIKVTDAAAGQLLLSGLDQDGSWATRPREFETMEVTVRRSGGWFFVNTHLDESIHWSWGRARMDGDVLIVWSPNGRAFRPLVSRGLLPGRIEESGKVILDPLTPAQDQMIRSGSEGVLMEWDTPIVFVRLRGPSRPPAPPVPQDSSGVG